MQYFSGQELDFKNSQELIRIDRRLPMEIEQVKLI
jgi:hypothetical protein